VEGAQGVEGGVCVYFFSADPHLKALEYWINMSYQWVLNYD
jgi:hypothetical protein